MSIQGNYKKKLQFLMETGSLDWESIGPLCLEYMTEKQVAKMNKEVRWLNLDDKELEEELNNQSKED